MNVTQLSEEDVDIYLGLSGLVHKCHDASTTAGWWTDLETGADLREELRSNTRLGKALLAEKLCLIHSEVSEAMEGARKNLMDDKLPQYSMLITELADAVIRIADLVGVFDEDLGEIVLDKIAFNANRPDHKIENRMAEGGKAF